MGIVFLIVAYLAVFASPVMADQGPATISDVTEVIRRIIAVLAPAAAIAFFIMAIWGGFKFVKSRGEPKLVEEARHIFQYAAIGAALVAASWLILVLIKNLTGCDVTTISFSNC
ncbi:hypothetical protein HY024_00650 [Candidatus Curtissbacteria bacterium]|nr:hypothetical protein [Candidatus Curtissbacteria bacterium]